MSIITNKNFTITTPPILVAFWLDLFCLYMEDFCADYDDYMRDPDQCVEKIEDLEKYYEDNYTCSSRNNSITKSDIRATCHLIVIFMNMSFFENLTDRDSQIKKYLERRQNAVYKSMGEPASEIVFRQSFFWSIGDTFRLLPKLRKLLFYFCLQMNNVPEFATACVILAHSSIITIKAMLDFIKLPKKTRAHSESIVLDEIHQFLQTIRKKKDENGALWPYHRILHPDDKDLNIANFSNLAVASIEYMRKYGGDTFKFMDTPTSLVQPDLMEKAITSETRDIAVIVQLTNEEMMAVREMEIDIKTLMGTRKTRDEADLNDPNIFKNVTRYSISSMSSTSEQ